MSFGFRESDVPKPTRAAEEIKYWGGITTVIDTGAYTSKILRMTPWAVGSMEYHLVKSESYYVLEGGVVVIFRVGRACDNAVPLRAGDTINIPRGMVHQSVTGESGCVIIETSTPDSARDSYLIVDGRTQDARETLDRMRKLEN